MKRIHLFELEDFRWFPVSIRQCITRLIEVMHRLTGSPQQVAGLVQKGLEHADKPAIIDLCSGSGGPMLDVYQFLKTTDQRKDLTLTLTDLYPDVEAVRQINSRKDPGVTYLPHSVDASRLEVSQKGLRTMVCSMHHMKPEVAHRILRDAQTNRQPICIFELSDNSFPIWLWWIAIPMNFIMVFFITPLVKQLTWKQLLFTYLIPVVPLCFAWDGAVSNARTYTLGDMDELLKDLKTADYIWEAGRLEGQVKKLYLLGLPQPVS